MKIKEIIQKNHLLPDIISSVCGLVLLVLIILTFVMPTNVYVIAGLFFAGGLLNVMNGLRWTKDKKKKNLGMSMIMLGVCIVIMGVYVIRFFYR